MNPERAPEQSVILFRLEQTTYAIATERIQQMEMVEQITPVPNTPSYVDGVIFVRGQVIPVINLRARFGFRRIPYDLTSRVVVVQVEQRAVGLIVDSAREFTSLDSASIQPLPETAAPLGGNYLQGVARLDDRPVLVVDVERLLAHTVPVEPANEPPNTNVKENG